MYPVHSLHSKHYGDLYYRKGETATRSESGEAVKQLMRRPRPASRSTPLAPCWPQHCSAVDVKTLDVAMPRAASTGHTAFSSSERVFHSKAAALIMSSAGKPGWSLLYWDVNLECCQHGSATHAILSVPRIIVARMRLPGRVGWQATPLLLEVLPDSTQLLRLGIAVPLLERLPVLLPELLASVGVTLRRPSGAVHR